MAQTRRTQNILPIYFNQSFISLRLSLEQRKLPPLSLVRKFDQEKEKKKRETIQKMILVDS